jgi:hypothetical protein
MSYDPNPEDGAEPDEDEDASVAKQGTAENPGIVPTPIR